MELCHCGFAVRGKNHKDGEHHKRGRPQFSKQQKKLAKRITDWENTKHLWDRADAHLHEMHRPGSLQIGKCR